MDNQYATCWQPELRHTWENYSAAVETEKMQCEEEGLNIAAYLPLFEAVERLPMGEIREKAAEAIFAAVSAADNQKAYPYQEPSNLKEIRALCSGEKTQGVLPAPEVLRKKVSGAWHGRIAGCLLGKPIEGMRRAEFHPLLQAGDNFPLHRYIYSTDITEELDEKYKLRGRCWADTVKAAPIDDDTNYTVLYQQLVERKGKNFTPQDVAELWLDSQSKNAYCTAERVAFCNFLQGYFPPYSAVYKNPYREWIGAQIRADYFGYINPGNPAMAAEMAWRDASVSHVKNGIYGEMFVAAMLACAAVTADREQVIRGGLAQIPQTSRLYEQVSNTLQLWKKGVPEETFWQQLHDRWDEYKGHHWCHTISNAVIVTAALLYGNGNYGKSICMAVQQGFDTDCNGATVGSVLGMLNGIDAIDDCWLTPLHGMQETSIFGVGTVPIAVLVEKTMQHIRQQ